MPLTIHKKYLLEDFELEPDTLRLTRNGVPVPLTHKPFQVLVYLIEHRERMVTRHELLETFWQGREVYEESLTKCVGAIRKALNDTTENPRFVVTHWAEGYRFIGEVTEDHMESSIDIDSAIERTRGVKITVEEEDEPETELEKTILLPAGRSPRKGWVIFAVAGLALLMVLGIVFGYRTWLSRTSAKPTARIRSIAVLPFKNLSGDQSEEYFSDGMTESLITALSKIGDLKVISRSSVFRYKGNETDPQDIGKQLNVSAVLEGNVRKDGDSVRVAIRLVSTDDGRILWSSESYDRKVQDIFALQDEIAGNVMSELRVKLSGDEKQRLARRYTNNSEAYQLFLKGRFYWNQLTQDALLESIKYYNLAIERDPKYALAYSGLADSYVLLSQDFLPPKDALPKAKEAATKALELDESLSEAHISMGAVKLFLEWDWNGAKREAARAKELNPSYQKAIESNTNYGDSHHFYCQYLDAIGQANEAISEIKQAMEYDPLSSNLPLELGWSYYNSRHYEETIKQASQLIASDPKFTFAYFLRATAYDQKGSYDQAITDLIKARTLADGDAPLIWGELGYAYAASGKKQEAQAIIEALTERSVREFVDPSNLAVIYAGLRDKEQTFAWLEKAYQDRSVYMVYLNIDPKLDNFRSEPRFKDLLRRVGLSS